MNISIYQVVSGVEVFVGQGIYSLGRVKWFSNDDTDLRVLDQVGLHVQSKLAEKYPVLGWEGGRAVLGQVQGVNTTCGVVNVPGEGVFIWRM